MSGIPVGVPACLHRGVELEEVFEEFLETSSVSPCAEASCCPRIIAQCIIRLHALTPL